MPILGITASSILKITDTGAMFPLQVITVGPSGASEINFTNIPNTYTHLQIRMSAKTTFSTGTDGGAGLYIQFNNDTTSSYSWHVLGGYTGISNSPYAGSGSTQAQGRIGQICQNTPLTDNYGAVITDILDYVNTSKFKTVRSLSGAENNSSSVYNYLYYHSALWQKTNAISSIKLFSDASNNFKQYSSFALYGIKGA